MIRGRTACRRVVSAAVRRPCYDDGMSPRNTAAKANRMLREYRDGSDHTPAAHELARIEILSVIADDRGMGGYAYRYYSEQLNRIDAGLPIEGMMEWTGRHPLDG